MNIKVRLWNPAAKVLTAGIDLNTLLLTTDKEFVDEFIAKKMQWLQFISAKDWRATEIYEDDIVAISKKDGSTFVGVVKYSFQMSAYFVTDTKKYMNFGDCAQSWTDEDPDVVYLTNLEVIGNVYFNPELLKL